MKPHLTIDFVSDVSCPWCAIGLKSLEQALADSADALTAELHFQPFELNPQMGDEGQNIDEHLSEKYGRSSEELSQARAAIRERAAAVGFDIRIDKRDRIYNTFDAHRLLHWTEGSGKQQALKHALLEANFTRGENPGSREVLLHVAQLAELDPLEAARVLDSGAFAKEVREICAIISG